MNIDVDAIEVPDYDGLLVGHHQKGPGHTSRRTTGTPDWLLIATLSGDGRISTPAGEFSLEPGSLALIAPGTPHDYGTGRTADTWEILWVHFHPPHAWLELLYWPPVAPGTSLLAPRSWAEISDAFREVHAQTLSATRRRRQFAMNALEHLLLLCETQLPAPGKPVDDRIRVVIEHIHGHLREPLTLESLGALVFLSSSRLSHLFREETGMSPLQYVGQQRIDRARRLLERTTMSITEIAAEVGMEPFHFSNRFRAATGKSPKNYRNSVDAQRLR